MNILIRQQSHGNGIYVIYNEKNRVFSKFGFSSNAISILKNEYEGLNWYYKNFNKPIKFNLSYESEKYFKLRINLINGKKIDYRNTISKNDFFVKKFINYYVENWPRNNLKSNLHGDLTLDNIFFSNQNVFIIDWENYSKNELDWGYDLCYFILSTFYLPIILKRKISSKDKNIFKNYWKILKNLNINNALINDPFNYFIEVYESKNAWNDINKPNKSKFLPFMLNDRLRNIFFELIDDK